MMLSRLLDAIAAWLEQLRRGGAPEPVLVPVPVQTPPHRRR